MSGSDQRDGEHRRASGVAEGDIGYDKTAISDTEISGTLPAESGPQRTPPGRSADRTGSTRDLQGKTLAGRYSVQEEIGRGGMSVVYRARHDLLNKTVAIKVLREELAGNKDSLPRFHREAKAAASIGDPHIVDITDYGFTEEGEAFIVMEHLEGQSLRSLLRSAGALGPDRTRAIAAQILKALGAAHERGIVHRDLKGDNVFITQRDGTDFVKVLDFGISKLVRPLEDGDATELTSTGQVLGTPQYLAPEQAHGTERIDHRVDIYAMGVILYEMLTAELPFTGSSVFEVLMKHAQEAPEPPRSRRPDLQIPPALEQVALKALAKKPEDRFASAAEMLAAVVDPAPPSSSLSSAPAAAGDAAGAAQPRPAGDPSAPRARGRGRAIAATAVVALLVAAGAGALVVWRGSVADTGGDSARPALDGRAAAATASPSGPDGRVADRESPARTATVSLTVDPSPRRAEVEIDGKRVGSGRVTVALPRSERPVLLRVTARGFRAERRELIPRQDTSLIVQLQPRRERPGNPRATGQDIKKSPYE